MQKEIPLGVRLNNPLNVRVNSNGHLWRGQCGQQNGFCAFTDIEWGVRAAMYLLLKSYPRVGAQTLEQCIHRWCPLGDGDNNPSRYVDIVCKRALVSPVEKVSVMSLPALFEVVRAMAFVETNFYLADDVLYRAYVWLES